MLLSVYSNRRLYYLLWGAWLLSIVVSWFLIAPATDDGIYLLPSLHMMHEGFPAVAVGESVRPVFFIVPTYAFFNGIFLSLQSVIGIDPGVYSFRTLNFVSLILLLWGSCRLLAAIKRSARISPDQYLLENLLLLLLAITPFVQNCWVARPEIFGFMLYIWGLLCVFPKDHRSWRRQLCGGALLGLAASVHPVLFLASGVTGMVIGVRWIVCRQWRSLICVLCSASIPLVSLLAWFLWQYEEVSAQLFTRSQAVAPKGIEAYFRGILVVWDAVFMQSSKSGMIKLYNALYYTPFALLFIGALVLFVRLVRDIKGSLLIGLGFALLCVSVVVLLTMQPFPPYFLSMSYVLVLCVCLGLCQSPSFRQLRFVPMGKGSVMLYIACVLAVCSHTLIHASKHMITDREFYHPGRTAKAIEAALSPEDHIMVTGFRLIPALAEIIDQEQNPVHPLFFFPNQVPERWEGSIEVFLHDYLPSIPPQNQVWAVLKPHMQQVSDAAVCIPLAGWQAHVVVLANAERVFEDAGNAWLRPQKVTIHAGECHQLLLRDLDES